MKKHNKKIALILVLALTLALAVPALAQTTTIQGAFATDDTQVINVEIHGGSTVRAILNPDGISAGVYATTADTTTKGAEIGQLNASGNITTMPIIGVNKGASRIAVRASVTSTLLGKFKFASSAPSATATTGLVWLEAKSLGMANANSSYDLGSDTGATKTLKYGVFNGEKVLNALNGWKLLSTQTTGSGANKKTETFDNWINNDLTDKDAKKVFTTAFNLLKKTNYKLVTKGLDETQLAALKAEHPTGYYDEIVILKKGTVECKQQLCVVPAAASETNPNYFIARLSGRIGEGPVSGPKAWDANDGFGASVIWTFQSLPNS